MDRVRAGCASLDFGVAGATVVDCGHPLPFPVLLAEMARLDCQFTFARRSFKRDIKGRALAVELQRVQEMWAALLERDAATVVRDQQELRRRVHAIVGQDR